MLLFTGSLVISSLVLSGAEYRRIPMCWSGKLEAGS